MKTRIFASVLLSILLHACTPSGGHTSQMLLTKADSTIRIPIGPNEVSTSRNIRCFRDHGKEFLAVENSTLHQINIYDLSGLTHVKTIVPQKEGPNGVGKMTGFDMLNFDTIYVTSSGFGFSVSLIDSTTTLKKKIDAEHNFKPYNPINELVSSYGSKIIKTKNGTFIPNNLRDNDDYFYNHLHEISIGYLFNNETGNCEGHTIKFPKIQEASSKVFRSMVYNVTFNSESPIINFAKGHQIFVRKDSIWEEHMAKSQYFITDLSERLPSQDITEIMKNYAKSPCYPVLFRDPYRNVYYRIAYPGVEVREGDNLMEMGEFRTLFSVMVIDDDFNVVDEMLMPENTYNINMFFVNEAGLWFSTNHVQNPDFEEDAINFQLFTLEYTS